MTSEALKQLFTTLAQVSFTLTGLLAIAIGGDKQRRDYWFENEDRSLFVYICFIMLILPGLVSVSGLIPSDTVFYFLPWPFFTIILGAVYLRLSCKYSVNKNKLVYTEERKLLKKSLQIILKK